MALLTLENYEEDYLKNIEIEHFDESMSFMDCALYSIAEGERTWNDIMKEMAVEELRYLSENGTDIIYEAADVKGFFESIKTWIMNAAKWVGAQFAKAIDAIDEFVHRNKAFVKKHENNIKEGLKKIPADGIDIGEGYYLFDNLSKYNTVGFFEAFKEVVNDSFKYKSVLEGMSGDISKVEKYFTLMKDKDSIKAAEDKVRGAILEGSKTSISAKDFKNEAVKYLYGEKKTGKVPASYVKKHIGDIISDITTCVEMKRKATDDFKKTKESLNGMIKDCKKAQKAIEKKDEGRAAKLAYFKGIMSIFKSANSIAAQMRGIQLTAYKARCKQSKAIATKLVGLAGGDKKKKEEAQNASFTYQFEDGESFFTSDLL